MMHVRFFSAVVLACSPLLVSSCAGPREEVRTIGSVTPYSTLTDDELKARYLVRLVELKTLNEEMATANAERDFTAVNAKAREGLAAAYDARQIARHLDDPAEREKRLKGIAKIIRDLEHLVEITGAGEEAG